MDYWGLELDWAIKLNRDSLQDFTTIPDADLNSGGKNRANPVSPSLQMTKFDPIIRGHSRPSVDTFSSPLSPSRNAQRASLVHASTLPTTRRV